jgi:hypothetical protein
MTRGGNRPGSGRKKGVPNRRTREMFEIASATGELPLEYMLRVIRNGRASPKRRDDMARAAAPFCHARLTAKETQECYQSLSDDRDWEKLLRPAPNRPSS